MEHLLGHGDREDKQLIADALGGSKAALERLLQRHYPFMYNVALRIVLSPADAQDLTQEAAIKVITKLAQFDGRSSFRTWLYRIVFNHFLNTRKRAMEQAVVSFDAYGEALDNIPDIDLSPQEGLALKEQVEDAKIGCMTGMLLCLSRKQRLVYVLGEIFELDSKTGSRLLGMSAANFRQILSRARKDLYQFMHKKCGLINAGNPCRCPKKTRGFIQAGWVNENNLQFNNHFVRRIAALATERANECDNLLEERYGALFKDHPYYDADKSSELINQLIADSHLKELFDL